MGNPIRVKIMIGTVVEKEDGKRLSLPHGTWIICHEEALKEVPQTE